MTPLVEKIAGYIRRGGLISFEKFMSMALYDPEFGYYNTEAVKIGRKGDYYTSSYLHPVFGGVIGRQIGEMWDFMGRPEDFRIVEMGAGAGYLCKDMLDSLRRSDFFACLRYSIVEQSPAMRKIQKDLLREYHGKVQWVSSLEECGCFIGCVFSNELLDAFPVHLVRMEDSLREIYLDFDDENGLVEQTGDLSTDRITAYFSEFSIDLRKGYKTEVNLRIGDWLTRVNEVLQSGFIFSIDYGYPAWDYYSEDRNRGTLLCYYKHQTNDTPYTHVGEQDITAHINFSSVKKWGDGLGLKTIGYCGQGAFMVSLGIEDDLKKIAVGSKDYVFEIARIKKLILPQGMGESHKIIIQYKGQGEPLLRGFSLRNQTRNL